MYINNNRNTNKQWLPKDHTNKKTQIKNQQYSLKERRVKNVYQQ